MATLLELYKSRNNEVMNQKVAAACWRYAKILLQKTSPTTKEVSLAKNLISDDGLGDFVGIFQIAVAVVLEDQILTDELVEDTVNSIGTKFLILES